MTTRKSPLSPFLFLCFALLGSPFQALAAPTDLDPAFGTGGVTTLDFGSGTGSAYRTVLQPDGRIVVVGPGRTAPLRDDIVVARLLTDGSPDPSFGAAGKVTVDFGTSITGGTSTGAIALLPDGRIVVAGTALDYNPSGGPASYNTIALARLNADGSLDGTFGVGGKTVVDLGGFSESRAVVLQPDGKIVVLGNSNLPGMLTDFLFVRLLDNGGIDASFGGGAVYVDFGTSIDESAALVLQQDGKLVGAGTTTSSASGWAFARLDPDGGLDNTFGGNGKVIVARQLPDPTPTGINDLVLQQDGKLVAAGQCLISVNPLSSGIGLVRLLGDGSLDAAGFAGGGIACYGNRASANALVLQPDGKLVTGGSFSGGGPGSDMAFMRVDSSGIPDNAFAPSGFSVLDLGSVDEVFDLARQSDGRLVASGRTSSLAAVLRLVGDSGAGGGAGIITLAASTYGVLENAGTVGIEVVRQGGSAGVVTVDFATADVAGPGEAVAGIDYTSTAGTLTWGDGDNTVKIVTVPIIDNHSECPISRAFTVSLSNPTGGATLAQNTTFVTISNNRPPCDLGNSSSGSGGCFFTRSVAGTPMEKDADTLRRFRDRNLMRGKLGRTIASIYYRISPLLARLADSSGSFRAAVRVAFVPVLFAIKHPRLSLLLFVGSLLLLAGIGIWRFRKPGNSPRWTRLADRSPAAAFRTNLPVRAG